MPRSNRGSREARQLQFEATQASWAGLAHDVSNLLQAVLGHAECLREQLRAAGSGSEAIQMLDGALGAGELAGCWMRQSALASQDGEPSPPSTDLNAVLREMESVLRLAVGKSIRMRLKYAAEPVWATANGAKAGRVILNLVLNARDAMTAGGRLNVVVEEVPFDEARADASGRRGTWGRITVSDTGPGIDSLERVFGHTTKQGHLGLGLLTARSLAETSGGFIEIKSAPGGGTTASVCFPSAPQDVNNPSPALPRRAPSPQGRGLEPSTTRPLLGERVVSSASRVRGVEAKFSQWQSSGVEDRPATDAKRILVVEDDPLVREILCRTLAGAGYRIFEASEAGQALELYEREARGVNLLLTDVHLQRISGPRLADWLRAKEPHLKILYVSGYPEENLASRGEQFLLKPFKPTELLRKVQEMLEAE